MSVPHSCLTCEEIFSTYDAAQSHVSVANHVLNPCVCHVCKVAFSTVKDLQMHLKSDCLGSLTFQDGRDESVGGTPEVLALDRFELPQVVVPPPVKPHCALCRRDFQSATGLQSHLATSSKHKPRKPKTKQVAKPTISKASPGRKLKCPFCAKMFKQPSAIANHIESGLHKCNRHQVTAAVHAMKIVPNISIKRITGPVAAPKTVKTYIATQASWNGKSYTCFICKKKGFKSLQALNGHLNSAAHDDDEFRCPKCKKRFTLISGFVQHLESHACGLAKSGQVNKYFNDLSGRFSRMLTM